MKGATSTVAGASGLVPTPAKGNQAKFLRGDGTWQTPTNNNLTNPTVKSGMSIKPTDSVNYSWMDFYYGSESNYSGHFVTTQYGFQLEGKNFILCDTNNGGTSFEGKYFGIFDDNEGGNIFLKSINNTRWEIDVQGGNHMRLFLSNSSGIYQKGLQIMNTGRLLAVGYDTESSKRYKDNIKSLEDKKAKTILDVNIVSYDYKENVVYEDLRYNHTGVIAEEVVNIIPEVVGYIKDDKGNNIPDSVDYSKFVPYLIKMIQIQQKEIDELKSKL